MEAGLFAHGVRNRLLSYVDLGETEAGGRRGQRGDNAKDVWLDRRRCEDLMRLYFAGNVLDQDILLYNAGVRNRLLTFAEIDDWGEDGFKFWLDRALTDKHVFIDCGAYSVLMRGAVIDLDRYCQFVRDNIDDVATIVALDVVGDAVTTRKNLEYMKAQGLDPVPVYTAMAPVAELERLLDEGYKHIALGGMRGREAGVRDWQKEKLDRTFRVLEKHWPIKTHLFGIMAQWALERYPIYSADSSGAIVGGGMGRLLLWEDGEFIGGQWRDYVRDTWDGSVADHVGVLSGTGSPSAHVGRRQLCVRSQLAFERYLTDLWARRGVTWTN